MLGSAPKAVRSSRYGAAPVLLPRAALLSLPASLAIAACGSGTEPPPRPRGTPFWSDGKHLRDAEGRVVILRGVNARVQGVFDVTFDDRPGDTRAPLEDIPALTDGDCKRMRALGFDLLRLPINWSGIEPEKDQIDEAYLANVDAAIACAASAGVSVIVDFHQDAYSKEIGEDGAPLWAIQPPPTMLLGGPLEDLGARRLSRQVRDAFETFFTVGDPSGMQKEMIDVIGLVAARYADNPAVVGIELYNEPDTGQRELNGFHPPAAAAVRDNAPDKLVFFEPPVIRNLFDYVAPSSKPFPVEGAVYSPHIYTCVFQLDRTCFDTLTAETLEPSVKAARREAEAWEAPLFIGEFGVGPYPGQEQVWMSAEAELHDRYLASNAYWVWKEQSQANWGLFDWDGEVWTERPLVVRWLSRVHPSRIGGEPVRVDYDWDADRLVIEIARGTATAAPTVVYVPERLKADGAYAVTCDGAAVVAPRDEATGLIEVACGGVLEVGPT